MDPNSVLSQLRDIHTPEAIGWWPLAWGWWVLGALILVIAVSATVLIVRQIRKTAWKRQALKALPVLQREYLEQPDAHRLTQLVTLMKRCLLSSKSSSGGKMNLDSRIWLKALQQPQGLLSQTEIEALYQGHYTPEPTKLDRQSFKRIQKWIRILPA